LSVGVGREGAAEREEKVVTRRPTGPSAAHDGPVCCVCLGCPPACQLAIVTTYSTVFTVLSVAIDLPRVPWDAD
jgi:hypothetical protein